LNSAACNLTCIGDPAIFLSAIVDLVTVAAGIGLAIEAVAGSVNVDSVFVARNCLETRPAGKSPAVPHTQKSLRKTIIILTFSKPHNCLSKK